MEALIKKARGFKDYLVSEQGDIYSLKKNTLKKLKPYRGKNGYHVVNVYKNGRPHLVYVHRLVLETFSGIKQKKPICDHINNNKTDNKLDNLRWVETSGNSSNSLKIKNRGMLKGVESAPSGNWVAKIAHKGCVVFSKTFSTEEEAHICYCFASQFYHGEYANPGYK